jgi:hypothetical protein
MLYCQSERLDHRAQAAYALTFVRQEDEAAPEVRVLACRDHAARSDERYGLPGVLALSRVEEVFEERVVVPLTRRCLETSALSPITIAYDRACRLVRDRGLAPVPTYRQPVRWLEPGRRGTGMDLVEAHVTLAVTRPRSPLPTG